MRARNEKGGSWSNDVVALGANQGPRKPSKNLFVLFPKTVAPLSRAIWNGESRSVPAELQQRAGQMLVSPTAPCAPLSSAGHGSLLCSPLPGLTLLQSSVLQVLRTSRRSARR
jgi:hypothetical protein